MKDNDYLNYENAYLLLGDLLEQSNLNLSPARLIEDCQHAQRRGVKREVPFLKGEKIKGRWHYKRDDVVTYVENLCLHHKGFKPSDISLEFNPIGGRALEAIKLNVPNLTRQTVGNHVVYSGISDGQPVYLLMNETEADGLSIVIKATGSE